MNYESLTFLPAKDANGSGATGTAALLVTRRRIQGWHLAPTGLGIVVDLYTAESGAAHDFESYEAYKEYIVRQLGASGFRLEEPPVEEASKESSGEKEVRKAVEADLESSFREKN